MTHRFNSETSLTKRLEASTTEPLSGTSRGRVLDLINQVRGILPKKEEPKPGEPKKEETPKKEREPKKEEKENPREEKAAEKKENQASERKVP